MLNVSLKWFTTSTVFTLKRFVEGIMDYGTQVQHADTGAHWQNGRAEKRIDVVDTRAHASLEIAGMDMKFFRHAVLYVVAVFVLHDKRRLLSLLPPLVVVP